MRMTFFRGRPGLFKKGEGESGYNFDILAKMQKKTDFSMFYEIKQKTGV